MGSGDGCAQETIFRACACCSATHLNTAIPRNCICASMGTGEAHTDVTKACTSVNNFIAGTGVLSIMLITAADKQYVHAEHGPQQQQHQITHPPSGADICIVQCAAHESKGLRRKNKCSRIVVTNC
eukprot:1158794-Pelagomonas_calceolata.AAC.4